MLLVLWVAILSSSLGFVCQFVGFRGLHASIALYQLAVTLLMAIFRAFLRSRRLGKENNKLEDLGMNVEGHELDWQALELERPFRVSKTHQRGLYDWLLNKVRKDITRREDENQDTSADRWLIVDDPLPVMARTAIDLKKTYTVPICVDDHIVGGPTDFTMACASFNERKSRHNTDHKHPNKAARLMLYRARMSYLTGTAVESPEHRWDSEIRQIAARLQDAIQESTDYIFRSMKLSKNWNTVESLVWSTACQLLAPSNGDRKVFPIHLSMYRRGGQWKISQHQLEAVLGLWSWSLAQLTMGQQNILFKKKTFAATESDHANEVLSAIRLWVTQTLPISRDSFRQVRNGLNDSYYPTTLSIPLRSLTWYSRTQENETASVLLSITTKSPPLQLIAQDIFALFISRLADIIEPLEEIEPVNFLNQNNATTNRQTLLDRSYASALTNDHLASIAETFISFNIGSREDALASIVPPLLQRSKLPTLDEVTEKLLFTAKCMRRKGQFSEAEDILRMIFPNSSARLQEKTVRSLGELYRKALRSRERETRLFGNTGLKSLCETKRFSEDRPLFDQSLKTLVYYNYARLFYAMESGDPRSRYDEFAETKLDIDSIISKPIMPSGLTLMDAAYLRNKDTFDLSRVLQWAVENNCPELIEDMWDCVLTKNGERGLESAMFLAIEKNCEAETLESLFEWPNIDLNLRKNQKTPLTLGSELGNAMAVELLVKQGADINSMDGRGLTPIQVAIENRQQGVFEYLLEAGADANAGENSALIMAVEWNRRAVESLLNHNAVINYKTRDSSRSPLLLASEKGLSEIAGVLLEKGAMPYEVNSRGEQPLSLAIAGGHVGMVAFLLKWCDTNTRLLVDSMRREPKYETLLHKAAVLSSTRIVELLLEYKADPTWTDKSGRTPLLFGIEMGSEEVLEPLVRTKRGINMRGREIFVTPLHFAADRGNGKLVTLLLQNGAYESAMDGLNMTPRMLAQGRGHEEVVRILLEAESGVKDIRTSQVNEFWENREQRANRNSISPNASLESLA